MPGKFCVSVGSSIQALFSGRMIHMFSVEKLIISLECSFNLEVEFMFVATAAGYDACVLCVLIATETYQELCLITALQTVVTHWHTLRQMHVVQVGPATAQEAPHMGRTLGPCLPFLIS